MLLLTLRQHGVAGHCLTLASKLAAARERLVNASALPDARSRGGVEAGTVLRRRLIKPFEDDLFAAVEAVLSGMTFVSNL